jgi:hypothetical protein
MAIADKAKANSKVDCDFALDILAALARDVVPNRTAEDGESRMAAEKLNTEGHTDGEGDLRASLRSEVQHVVKVLQMAKFLKVERDFMSCARLALRDQAGSKERQATPTLLDMLDILHPTEPTMCKKHYLDIKEFCIRFRSMDLEAVAIGEQQLARAQLPVFLVGGGYTVHPNLHHHTVVPRELCGLLDDLDHTHWIPEILIMASKMAEAFSSFGRSGLDTTGLYYSSQRGFGSKRAASGTATNQDVLFDLLKSFDRFSFDVDIEEIKITIDRQMVPLVFAQTDGVPSLHVNKKEKIPRPCPGYFIAMSSLPREGGADQETPVAGWIYDQSHAKHWTVRWQQDESAGQMTEVGSKDTEASVFEGLAKRLNASYGSIREMHGEYEITSQGVRFTLSSTEDEYVLRLAGDGHAREDGLAGPPSRSTF